jgi:hypothetical protein
MGLIEKDSEQSITSMEDTMTPGDSQQKPT